MDLYSQAQGSLIQAFIGKRGCGKSTKFIEQAKARVRAGGRALLVPSTKWDPIAHGIPAIGPEELLTFTGFKKIFLKDVKEMVKLFESEITDCLIIFDDVKGYMPSNAMNGDVRQALISSRHRRLDLCFSMHGFTQVPPDLFTYIDYIFLHATTDSLARLRDNFRNLDKLKEATQRVNKIAAGPNKTDKYYCEIISNSTD